MDIYNYRVCISGTQPEVREEIAQILSRLARVVSDGDPPHIKVTANEVTQIIDVYDSPSLLVLDVCRLLSRIGGRIEWCCNDIYKDGQTAYQTIFINGESTETVTVFDDTPR